MRGLFAFAISIAALDRAIAIGIASRLRLDLKRQPGVIDEPTDQSMAHGRAGCPDAAWNVSRIAQQADRTLCNHLRRRSIAGVAITGHGNADLPPVGSKAYEQQIVEARLTL